MSMMMVRRLVIFFLIVGQKVTVFPPRVGAQIGEQNVFLGCIVTDMPVYNFMEWIYFPAWKPTGFTIYSSYSNITYDQTNFTVDHTTLVGGTQSSDLVINTAHPALATQYLCRLTPSVGFEAAIDVMVLGTLQSWLF